MSFDTIFERRGHGSSKWDAMGAAIGVTAADGLPMWVADMDFAPAPFIVDAARKVTEVGDLGYFIGWDRYFAALKWWTKTRHGWDIEPEWCSITAGLGNGIAIALHAFTRPDDGVAFFTPVYHEFANKVSRAGRRSTELPLGLGPNGKYIMDLDAAQAALTGREKMLILCSPHNPAGRVWTQDELKAVADFCVRNDLLLISDEIHCDLTLAGHKHIPMAVACPEIMDRLVMMTSASKTFNLAGLRTGNVIIPDKGLRDRFVATLNAFDLQGNLYGVRVTTAAYSPEGAAWVDELQGYLGANAALFNGAMSNLPGLVAMPMESTYLSWIDFSGTGMSEEEIDRRIKHDARIAASPGIPFGSGGALHRRFNLGTQRSRVQEAIERMNAAFSDLQ